MKQNSTLKIRFLGGVGEIGKNMTALEYGKDIIVIDAGVTFPSQDMPGIDLVIPDISYLTANKDRVRAIILTHGHEDHIGAISYILKDINVPIYGTKMSLALVETKLAEFKITKKMLKRVNPRDRINLGAFSVEFINVNHSIAGACAFIRGRTEIPRPYLSVALAGQPYIWDNMMNDTAFRSSGLIARFVPCFAKSDVGNRRYDTAPISKEVREQYHNFIHQLLRGKKDHNGEETILRLSRHASEEYIEYCNNYIEQEIKQSMCCCQDWGGKFHGLILRIACILHCADCCSRGIEPSEESVNHDTLLRAFNLAHYYRYQAIYGFSVNAPDGNIVKAEKIIQIIKTKNIKQGLKSDLYHACRCNLFPSAKDFYSALDTLAEYGYIAYEDVTAANNKKAQMVHVNPHI